MTYIIFMFQDTAPTPDDYCCVVIFFLIWQFKGKDISVPD